MFNSLTEKNILSNYLSLSFACLGGICMGLTTAPVQAFFLAWVAFIPLWLLIFNRAEISYKKVFFLGIAWGCGYHGLGLFWITGIHPMTWMGVPWLASLLIAIFCWVFITLWGAILVATWSVLMRFFQTKISYREGRNYFIVSFSRIVVGTALWCGLEALWSRGDLWWTSLSFTQSPHNLLVLQLSHFSGPATVTAAIVVINGLIAEGILSQNSKIKSSQKNPLHNFIQNTKQNIQRLFLFFIALLLLVTFHLVGWKMYSQPLADLPEKAIKVGLIQGNIPNTIKLNSVGLGKAIQGYTQGYQKLATQGVDGVLLPETALPFVWDNRGNFYREILRQGIPAWVGAFGKQDSSYTNSLFSITGNGELISRYDKAKLVPLGEYIPFESILGKVIDRLSPLDAHLTRGKPEQVFQTPFGQAIVGICYESAFPEVFRRQAQEGGEFILSSSNDAHYSEVMPRQHHAQDIMRAIETERWTVRATNTGYSAIVDPRGNTEWISKLNQYQIHSHVIYGRSEKNLYVRWGDWLTWVLLVISGLIMLFVR